MFSLSTTTTLHHTTALPPHTTLTHALSALQNHNTLLHLDPDLSHYEPLPPAPSAPLTARYKVTDNMHALPKGLWDTTVVYEAAITNTADGVEWVIRAPLGLVQRTVWRVAKRSGAEQSGAEGSGAKGRQEEVNVVNGVGEWCLVEEVEITANRVLLGVVRGKCEQNWRGVHARFVEGLDENVEGEGGSV